MLDRRRFTKWSPLAFTLAAVAVAAIAIVTGAPAEAALPALLLLGAVAALSHGTRRSNAAVETAGAALRFDVEQQPAAGDRAGRPSDPQHFVAREFAAARRGRPVTLVMFGFSCFDEFVESEGAQAGTEAVREFGRLLSRMTRQMNLSARYGWRADAFLSVLSDADSDAARMFVRRVREAAAVCETRLPQIDAGIATWQPHLTSPDEFVEAAERALDAARAETFVRVRPYGSRVRLA